MEPEGSLPHSQESANCPYPGKFIVLRIYLDLPLILIKNFTVN